MPTEKFKAMVHFIIDECGDPARLGAVRLNKICWYSDTVAYRVTGASISGEKYVKRQMGPVPASILAAIRELEADDAIAVSDKDFGSFKRRDFMSKRDPNRDMLSEEEKNIIRAMLRAICDGHSAASISELSHDQIWQAAAIGEEIPMFATLAAKAGEVSGDTTAWADNMVADIEGAKQKAA